MKDTKTWTQQAIEDTKDWTEKTAKEASHIRVDDFKEWGTNTIKDFTTNAQEFIESGKPIEIASQVGDFTVKAAKTVSGVEAYNERKEAIEKKKEAETILSTTQKRIDEVRFLANNRLETYGIAKCEILKTTVGRFIKIVSQLKNSVKVKEYDLSMNLSLKEHDVMEMELNLMASTLQSINSLAASSPFKDLNDLGKVKQCLSQGGEWDI